MHQLKVLWHVRAGRMKHFFLCKISTTIDTPGYWELTLSNDHCKCQVLIEWVRGTPYQAARLPDRQINVHLHYNKIYNACEAISGYFAVLVRTYLASMLDYIVKENEKQGWKLCPSLVIFIFVCFPVGILKKSHYYPSIR